MEAQKSSGILVQEKPLHTLPINNTADPALWPKRMQPAFVDGPCEIEDMAVLLDENKHHSQQRLLKEF